MVILHIVSVNNPNGNGVIAAVNNYVKYESQKCHVAIYNLGNDIAKNVDDGNSTFSNNVFHTLNDLPTPYNRPDLVIFNEIYKYEYLKLYKQCIKLNIPYIIIPHGCLVKSAQKKKKVKKMLANFMLFNKFIEHSLAIQFLNDDEKNNSIAQKHKYIISGNGISISKTKNKYKNKDLVFIGRYDVKVKGLDLLIKTIAKNKAWFLSNGINLQMYGRSSGNGFIQLKKLISSCKVADVIKINDAVYGEEKKKILLDSYAFIQVSRHEGQPMGIMEALSHGIPCIVTYGTSFGDYINTYKCGIGIDFNEHDLIKAIKRIYTNSDFRDECSKNTIVVERHFEWNSVIERTLEQYKNLIK